MILIQILGAFMIAFGIFSVYDSRFVFKKGTGVYEAEIIDEVEDELYDNTGGLKTRFFKVYRYEEGGEGVVVRAARPMRRISDTVGEKRAILVDKKNRRAFERKDSRLGAIWGIVLFVFGVLLIAATLWVEFNVEGAAVLWTKE